jgi:DNA-binding transcriptional ArsR family regulator
MEAENTSRFADMFAALGSEPRLQIVRLLLSAHPEGLTVGEIQAELDIPNSTLSHHLEKLRMEGLVNSRRDKQWLWYSVNAEALQELLSFLYAECCTRSRVVEPVKITSVRAKR